MNSLIYSVFTEAGFAVSQNRPGSNEVWAKVLIRGLLSGRTVDMDEVRAAFTNRQMIAQIENYSKKAAAGSAG